MSRIVGDIATARPRKASLPPPQKPPARPLIGDTGSVKLNAVADVINTTASPFQNAPDPAKGTLGEIEHGIGAVMGVVGAPFQLLDTGFAMITAPLAAMMPGLPRGDLDDAAPGHPTRAPPSFEFDSPQPRSGAAAQHRRGDARGLGLGAHRRGAGGARQ